ncbi:MAG: hypothetical protein ACC645_23625, partial [Pirellulales bacterium]
PDSANILVVLNAQKIFDSAIARREGWKQNYEQAFAAAPMMLPPSAEQFVLGAHLNLEFMQSHWEAAVMRLSKDPTIDEVAKRVGGMRDKVAGKEAIETPSDQFIVKFAPYTFGVVSPATRQFTAAWVRDVEANDSVKLSPYLQQAAGYAEKHGTEIIYAIDLHDALRQADIRANLGTSEVLEGKEIDLDKLSQVMASIQGATLGVVVGEKVYGKLKVDFGEDAAIFDGIARPLLLEILGRAGAMIDDFETWKPTVRGKRIAIEGPLSLSGMRKLFSVLELDASSVASEKVASKGPADAPAAQQPNTSRPSARSEDNEATMAYTTQQYFKAVNKYLGDLRRKKGARSIGQYGLWFEKYARKIDKMPILNVDPEMIDYGQYLANSLRDAVSAIQGIGIRSGARSAQIYGGTGTVTRSYGGYGPAARYGAYGGYRVYGGYGGTTSAYFRNIQAERRAVRKEERAKGALEARGIFKQMDQESAQIRRKMTEKYQIEF